MVTIAYIFLTAASSIHHKADSGGYAKIHWEYVFWSLFLKDSGKKIGFGGVDADEKKESFLTGGYS